MKENFYLEKLMKIINHYDVYKQIAVNLEWVDAEEKHMLLYYKYPLGFSADFYKFPKGYLKDNFENAYVQSVLMGMGDSEEWAPDFWKIPKEEREYCLTVAENLYKGYICYEDFDIKEVTVEYIIDLMIGYIKKSVQTENCNWVKDFVAKAEKNIELVNFREKHFVSFFEDEIMAIEFGIYD